MIEQDAKPVTPELSRRALLFGLLGLEAAPLSFGKEAAERVVKVGFLRAYDPFSHIDGQGRLHGFDVDVMRRLCELIGWNMEVISDNLAGLTRRLQAGEIAWLGNQLLMTTENRRQMDFVRPAYASIQLCAIQHEDDARDFLSLDELQGKRLGVLANSGMEEQARGVLGRTVRAYEHVHDALHDLAQRKLDLVLEENLIADYYIDKHQLPLRVAAPFTAQMAVGLGVRKGNRDMNETLSQAIRQILRDGSFKRISEKWFGYDVSSSRTSHTREP